MKPNPGETVNKVESEICSLLQGYNTPLSAKLSYFYQNTATGNQITNDNFKTT